MHDKINLDLKEGKAFYSTPFDMLNIEQLAKGYAYALQTWGDSMHSRSVLEVLRKRDARCVYLESEDIDELKCRIRELELDLHSADRELDRRIQC